MTIGSVILVDDNPARRNSDRERLLAHGYEVMEAETAGASVPKWQGGTPDLVLLRLASDVDHFREVAEQFAGCGAFIVLFIERDFSPDFRKEALALKADGFVNETLPVDEWIAAIDALIRKKQLIDKLRALRAHESQPVESEKTNDFSGTNFVASPLRDRAPELYKDILLRYEEGIKLVLRHRIYKIDDDIFEPFRQIAKQLFLAQATARDAVQLHYQTLRKIAPTTDAPGAQAYLEVGRTTIIGLLGDLLTCYRDAHQRDSPITKSASTESNEQV